MKIKNVSTSIAVISDIKDSSGEGLTLQPNSEVIIHDEDAEKSSTLQQFITDGIITVTGTDEPLSGVADADTLAAIASHDAPVTRVLYVDKQRADTYTANGSISKPFKTIQAAIDAVAVLGLAEYLTIDISNGVYLENLVLENAGIKDIKLQGHGYVSINPASGNALQSTANNDNLFALYVENIVFAKPVVLTGSSGATSFSDVWFKDVSFTGTSSLTATCINNLTFTNLYSERPFVYNNVVWSYIESAQLQGTFNITMDSAQDFPSGGSDGTILANGVFESGTLSYTIGGTATYTVAPNGCRWGAGAVTVPAGVSVLAYNSFLRGTITNNGSVTLRNSTMEGYVAGTGTLSIVGQPASQVANVPAGNISATDVQSAVNELDTEKAIKGATAIQPDATEINSAIALVNELKDIINTMNA